MYWKQVKFAYKIIIQLLACCNKSLSKDCMLRHCLIYNILLLLLYYYLVNILGRYSTVEKEEHTHENADIKVIAMKYQVLQELNQKLRNLGTEPGSRLQ